jgi:predicted methyltransferase
MKNMMMGAALTGLLLTAMPALAQAPSAAINAAVADAVRTDADKAVDAMRKPAETIAFAGVKPGDKVAELNPGGGYFTRIFSKLVGANGKVYTFAAPRPNAPPPAAPAGTNATPLSAPLADFATPEPVDVVWTSRNYHDFQNAAGLDMVAFNRKVFAALKPGGTYIVLDHAAAANAAEDVTSKLHRAKEATVRSQIEAAGFRFVSSSNVLHNAADNGTMPVREQDVAGKTNQFILKFQKP